jgi:YfiH family protein
MLCYNESRLMQAAGWIETERPFGTLAGLREEGLFHFFGTRALSFDEVGRIGPVVRLKQVHGNRVLAVESPPPPVYDPAEGDALVTDRSGILLSILTADCVPLLFFDPRLRVIGAAHAGWRGTLKGIGSEVVGEFSRRYGSSPENLRVGIGPSIGPCCYEVGEEVLSRIPSPLREAVVSFRAGRAHLDLVELNRRQLVEAGVSPEKIDAAGLCTACDPKRFFSYRRDRGRTGSLVSGILLKEE